MGFWKSGAQEIRVVALGQDAFVACLEEVGAERGEPKADQEAV